MNRKLTTLLTLLAVSSGYTSAQVNQTEAPDGFYVGADTGPSYALPIVSNDGGPVTVQIREDSNFSPKQFVISATDKIPGGYFVKINGQSTNGMTDLPGIVIIANHKAYFGYARRVGSSATVALLLNNREEAVAVDSMLEKRFLLPPSPIGLPITNLDANKYTVQDLSPSTNWHWDQAMADALLAKGNHDNSITEALAYSRMMGLARVNNMPEPPSEFPLPNFEAGPGRPLPVHVNFYCINDHYPNYLLCQYDVDKKNYNQSDEPVWFNAVLKQIRHSGPKKFPPIKWIAVVIDNRADWKGAGTFDQCYKVGAIFKAGDVFDSSRKFSQLMADAHMDRHPFKYDQLQPTPGDEQRWLIVERHAATNSLVAGSN
jgi:hypothetical protein